MRDVLLGTFSFAWLLLMDWAAVRDLHKIRPLFFSAAGVTFIFGWVGVMQLPAQVGLPNGVTILGWIALVVFALLLIYSLFIEIPLRSTYIDGGADARLVTTGTYALSRHPGVLWFAGLVMSMLLINPSKTTLLAGVAWLSADILLVLVEDIYFFPRMFPTYSTYQSSTPFLLPNRRSLRRCLDSLPMSGKTNLTHKGPQAGKVPRNDPVNEKSSMP
jgi:protein-S-isoprenylcysteine O-methyltransferase Ste14